MPSSTWRSSGWSARLSGITLKQGIDTSHSSDDRAGGGGAGLYSVGIARRPALLDGGDPAGLSGVVLLPERCFRICATDAAVTGGDVNGRHGTRRSQKRASIECAAKRSSSWTRLADDVRVFRDHLRRSKPGIRTRCGRSRCR